MSSWTKPIRDLLRASAACMLLGMGACLHGAALAQSGATQATTVPLLLPGSVAYDAAGNLFFAETGAHRIRRMAPDGVLTTAGGTGAQGFGGDGGPATAALFDSPAALTFDAAGNLFVADTHNHRIRRIDRASGIVTTFAGTGSAGTSPDGTLASAAVLDGLGSLVAAPDGSIFFSDDRRHVVRRIDGASGRLATVAGSGVEGFSGDGGPATAAALDRPAGIALDAAGNLFLSDSRNHRVRRVDAGSGVITTVAGTGLAGSGGDGGAAGLASVALPRGLVVDATGDLFIVDAASRRVRRIELATGVITTVAGQGTEAFAGDEHPAVAAALDSPEAATVSPDGLLTLADTANGRLRQVDSAAVIHTIAGLGSGSVVGSGSQTLALHAPTVVTYGTGTLTATLAASPATGSVTLLDLTSGTPVTLAMGALTSNAALFSTSTLAAGAHRLQATYAGDDSHPSAVSDALTLRIAPAPVSATVGSVATVYGAPIPPLTGQLTGVLPQDAGAVTLALSTTAPAALLGPGRYPITATLTGAAAADYTLTAVPGVLVIARAAANVTLTKTLAVAVASSTAGLPSGSVSLLDGSVVNATATLSPAGGAQFALSQLSVGTHTLTAAYAGDTNFLPSSSAPDLVTIGQPVVPDFTLAATGQTALTVASGTPAAFSFAITPVKGVLASEIVLAASGLPVGATASFNPAYIPPGGTVSAFVLTIQTAKRAELRRTSPWVTGAVLAGLLPVFVLVRRSRGRRALGGVLLVGLLGCGDRINTAAINSPATRTYTITVNGAATSATGGTLLHTATVTLNVE